ncbi:ATPase, T2SS/T4P/T4SS family, partial [Pseudomonas viridiflava]|uniref:ATPase, T2SS/T4P/T4SS family n=1 Tax=Pseudomonas viridiflava TaxID=33069 RepID=UPI00311ED02E
VEDDKLSVAIDRFFDSDSGLGSLADIGLDLDIEPGESAKETSITSRDDADDAPVVRFVNKMLLDAIQLGSSDLHFEPYEKVFRVRFRTDGILHEAARPPINLANRIAA